MGNKPRIWTKAHWFAALFLLLAGFWALGVWTAVWSQSVPSVEIPIQNPNFESTDGWTFTSLGSGSGGGFTKWNDGSTVAVLLNQTLSQDLQVTPRFGVYVLTFYIANWFYAYPGQYTASVSIGPTPVCSSYGWAIGNMSKVTVVCPVSNYITLGYKAAAVWGFDPTKHLILSVTNTNGWQIVVGGKVSLQFTPGE